MSFPSFLILDAKTSYRQKIDDGVDLLAILTEQYKRKAIIENNPFILVVFGDEARDVIYRSSTARALELPTGYSSGDSIFNNVRLFWYYLRKSH